MLTIRKIQVEPGDHKGAMTAARYPLEQGDSPQAFVRPEAESGPEAPASAVWMGSSGALARLGLERGTSVSQVDLARTLQGQHTRTKAQVRRPGSVPDMDADGVPVVGEDGEPLLKAVVNSYDLTFSAPKSVSILWSQADAELRAELERAMMVASHGAIEHVTRNRPVVMGKSTAVGFAASAALHVTARTAAGETVPAPQLHVHSHLVGVLGDDGRLFTPNSAALFKNDAMREGGAVGRALLAEELRLLGFDIEAGNDRNGRYFEVAGVPAALRERMSGRSRDILAWVKEQESELGGTLDNRDRANGALVTRAAKVVQSAAEIQDYWDAQSRELDFDDAALVAMRDKARVRRPQEELSAELREGILRRIWAEGPTVTVGAARSIAFELAPIGLSPAAAAAVLSEMQEAGELIALDQWRVTSREIRRSEEYVHDVALKGGRERTRGLTAKAIATGVEVAERGLRGGSLDPEQRDAVKELSLGAGWATLTGRAGTGKGPVLQAVAEAHRSEGWRVVAAAVDGATTQRLGQQIGAPGMTIEQMLFRLENGTLPIDGRTLIMLEEASKIGLRHWEALARLRERSGARLIAIGDVEQIGAIESPGMLDAILAEEEIPKGRLSTVRRHRDPNDTTKTHPWLARYLGNLYEGKAGEAIKILRQEGAISMHPGREEAMVGLVDTWARRRRDHGIKVRDAVLVVYGTNQDVDEVNRLAQDRRLKAKEIAGPGVAAADRNYSLYKGDVVMMRGSAYEPSRGEGKGRASRIENGTAGLVVSVDPDDESVEVDFDQPGQEEPRRVRVGLKEMREAAQAAAGSEQRPAPSLRLAYAGHPFPLQGGTWDYVGSLWGHWSQRKEETYSGDARARLWLDVHVDADAAGSRGNDDDRYRRLVNRLRTPRHRFPSIGFAETPEIAISPSVSAGVEVPPMPQRRIESPREPDAATAEIEESGEELEEREERSPAPIVDPLAAFRNLLGPARIAVIRERAEELAERASELDQDDLRRERDEGSAALAKLDRPAAREAQRIEHDQIVAATEADRAAAAAVELEAAASLRGVRRQRRRELRQEAEVEKRTATKAELSLREALDREVALRGSGSHPDDWVDKHGEAFAFGIAAERQLTLDLRLREEEPELDADWQSLLESEPEGPELDFDFESEGPELDFE